LVRREGTSGGRSRKTRSPKASGWRLKKSDMKILCGPHVKKRNLPRTKCERQNKNKNLPGETFMSITRTDQNRRSKKSQKRGLGLEQVQSKTPWKPRQPKDPEGTHIATSKGKDFKAPASWRQSPEAGGRERVSPGTPASIKKDQKKHMAEDKLRKMTIREIPSIRNRRNLSRGNNTFQCTPSDSAPGNHHKDGRIGGKKIQPATWEVNKKNNGGGK